MVRYLTAYDGKGTAVITVKSGKITAKCKVKVK